MTDFLDEEDAGPIAPSGMGGSTGLPGGDVYQAACAVFRASASAAPDEPAPRRTREGARAGRSHLGLYTDGPVQGLEVGDAWAAVALGSDAALLGAMTPLVDRRGGRAEERASPDEIVELWRRERGRGLRAMTLVGEAIPWRLTEQLALDGCLVGRIPTSDPGAVRAYGEGLASREREEVELPRLAWIVEAASDPFTIRLAARLSGPLEKALHKKHFRVVRSGLELPGELDTGELPPPGVVVLLTHGTDPPGFGDPLGLGPRAEAWLRAACRGGAIAAHLGCNGAGMIAGGRFEDLPDRLGLEACPRLAADGFSAFGRACLSAGATAVLAHVDSTWSSAFADARPLVDWLDWLCSGGGAAAYAAGSIFTEAERQGRQAYEALKEGREMAAGRSWLRHLDLRGFVTLGDACAHARFSR